MNNNENIPKIRKMGVRFVPSTLSCSASIKTTGSCHFLKADILPFPEMCNMSGLPTLLCPIEGV